jgi:hypothetical protein
MGGLMKNILLLTLLLMLAFSMGCCNTTWRDTVKSTHLIAPDYKIPTFVGSHDAIAYQAQRWAVLNLTYVSDNGEYWQNDLETITKKEGDCEDGAILIYSMMLRSGVPADRIKVVGGYVYDETGPGGHAWCMYKRQKDNEWIVLDWCFIQDSGRAIVNRIPFRQRSEYGKIMMYIIGE